MKTRMTLLALLLSGPAVAEAPVLDRGAPAVLTAPNGKSRSLASKLRELSSVADYGAAGAALIQNYLVTAAKGSRTVTFAQARNYPAPSFSASLVGSRIEIGVATGPGGVLLSTTIAEVKSPTEIVLADPARTGLSGAEKTVVVGDDDTAALQAAFDASTTAPVYVPCGVYKITARLTIPRGGTVFGRITNPYYYAPGQAPQGSPLNVAPPCATLIGDPFSKWAGQTAALVLGGDAHLEGIGVDISRISASIPVIYGKLPWNEVIHNFTFGGSHGIFADYNGAQQNQGWVISSNEVSSAKSIGVYLNNTSDSLISKNWVHSAGVAGIGLAASGSVAVIANVTEENAVCGLYVYGGLTASQIVGNKIAGNHVCGLQLLEATGVVAVTGNNFANNGVRSANGAHWNVAGKSSIQVTAAANAYLTGVGTPFMIHREKGATIGPRSAFYEDWPPMNVGVYDGIGARDYFQPMLLSTPNNVPGPYANDAAAAAAGVPIGAEYYDASGVRRRRVS